MLTMFTNDATGLVELTIDGRIERADFDRVVAELERLLAQHSQLNVVEVITNFDGIEPALWWKDTTWGFSHILKVARVAVVTDAGWIGPIARAIGAILPSEIKSYPIAHIEEARIWATEGR